MPTDADRDGNKKDAAQPLKLGLYLGAQNPGNNRPSLAPRPPTNAVSGSAGGAAPGLRVRQSALGGRLGGPPDGSVNSGVSQGASLFLTRNRQQQQQSGQPQQQQQAGSEGHAAASAGGAGTLVPGPGSGGLAIGGPGTSSGGSGGLGADGRYGFSSTPRGVGHRRPPHSDLQQQQEQDPTPANGPQALQGVNSRSGTSSGAPRGSLSTGSPRPDPLSPGASTSRGGQGQRSARQGAGGGVAGEERVSTPPLLAQPWGHGMGPMVGRPGSSGSEPRMAEEDEETQNNVKRWFKRLQDFKASPDAPEFIYLRHARPGLVATSPYNLIMVDHADIKALNARPPHERSCGYYTMSAKGVTHHVDGCADFTSLDQFERDYFLYRHLLRLRMFAQYRLWKAFKVWRRFVASRKARSAKEALSEGCFSLNPVFRAALVRMRTACYELQQMRLHALERGTLYDLDDLAARHAARHEETRALLEGFSETIVHQAQDACVAAMQLMEDQVMGIKRGAAGQGAHTVPGPGMKAVPAPVPAPVPVPAPAPVANGVTGGDGEGSGGAEGLPSAAAGEADDRSAAGAAADGGGEALGVAGGSTAEDGQGQEQGQEQGEEQLAAQAGAVQVQLLQGPDAAAGDGDGAQSTATGFTAAAASSPGRKGSGGAGAGYARSVAPSFFSPDMVGGDFSYALSAARRSYKRRIHAFVRLLDYMVCGALHELVVESTLDLVDALTPAPVEAKPAAGGRVQAEPAAAAADDTGDLHESVSKAPNEAGEEAVQVEEEQEVAMSWGVDGGNVLKISVCLQAAAGSPTSPSRPGMQAARRAGLSFSSRRSMLASRTTSRTALTAVPEALLAQEDGLEGAGGEQQQALQYGVVLSPPPLEYLSTFSRIQTTWVQQVQSVARLLPHPKLQDYLERPVDSSPGLDVEGFNELLLGSGYLDAANAVLVRLRGTMAAAEEYARGFEDVKDGVLALRPVDEAELRLQWEAGRRDLEGLRQRLEELQRQLGMLDAIPSNKQLGVLRVQLSELVAALRPGPARAVAALSSLLPRLAAATHNAFISSVQAATSRLTRPPSSPVEFAEHLAFLAQCEAGKAAMDREYDVVVAHYDLMEDFGIPVPDMQAASYATLDRDYAALRDAMWAADSARERLIEHFGGELGKQVEGIIKQVATISMQAQHDMVLDERSNPEVVIAFTGKLVERVEALQAQADQIQQLQRTFCMEETRIPELEDCAEDVRLRHQLWTSVVAWAELTATWLGDRFEWLAPAAMEEQVGAYSRAVFKMERGLLPNKIVPKLRSEVTYWRELVPLVAALRNPHLRERHWVKINAVVGTFIDRDEGLTLQKLLDMNLLSVREAVQLVSTEATQEAALEAMLEKVSEKWKHVELSLRPYKALRDTYVLGGVDEVQQVLEDSAVMMAAVSASRYVAGIRSDVERLDRQLRLFSDTLEEWLECQRQWLSLEPILTAADIQRQLPSEARAFTAVDRQLKEINRKARDRPNALQAGTQPGLLEQLRRCNEALEGVAKNLEEYLESKRVAFPRFYFLSNDELLQILSQTRNPQAVQPHLRKCFDGIHALDFGEDARSYDILAMCSEEGERVPLARNLKARGSVEQWLGSVEAAMRSAVRGAARRAYRDYAGGPGRWDWVRATPAQLVLACSNIHWAKSVEACFRSRDAPSALGELHASLAAQLGDLMAVVRGAGLGQLERRVLVALITTDVHNRDVVDALIHRGCVRATDFVWQMQLRYEYETAGTGPSGAAAGSFLAAGPLVADPAAAAAHGAAAPPSPGPGHGPAGSLGSVMLGGAVIAQDEVIVRQVTARFHYGWEYLGAQPRLVITPMTDRCFLTLTGALHLRLGGAPAGPAGTGKTETVKDLAKALGVQCVVFNCGDNLDFRFMGKFFSGLAQCGAWACFDEFNRIDIEVLSVVAQQLLAIQTALRAGVEHFAFEGREIRLLPSCGVFVTMNQGYAGRTELPENLQALFRPMAMMVPDYGLVAEVMLFSEGFEGARPLSRKMVQLYRLASEQLSQQDHYDFGMRALKSVLVTAGSLKRSCPDVAEELVLIRAMRESNVPKFLSEDARLFDAILCDLFPGVELPEQHHPELQGALEEACGGLGLQPVPPFLSKAVQLWETFNVRFGAMLIGPPGGGKTSIYRALAAAVTRLHGQAAADAGGADGRPFTASSAANPWLEDPGLGAIPSAASLASFASLPLAHALNAAPDCPYQPVHTHVVNPKAITLGELYGAYHPATNEWQDGLASSIIRGVVAGGEDSADLQWVVFDGPVDTVWVEDMNTVLDDNCTLCLPNGERIKLRPATMRVLFEVADLAAASPATVSRCGMVYVPPDQLGWKPYVRSWLEQLPSAVLQALAHCEKAREQPTDRLNAATSTTASGAHPFGATADMGASGTGPRAFTIAGTGAAKGTGSGMGVGDPADAGAPGPGEPLYDAHDTEDRPGVSQAVLEYLELLFDKFLEPLLAFVRRHGTAVPSSEGALVAATCALLQSLLLSTQLQGHPGAEGSSLRRHSASSIHTRAHQSRPSSPTLAKGNRRVQPLQLLPGDPNGHTQSGSAGYEGPVPYKDPLLNLAVPEVPEPMQVSLNYLFAFAAVWGVGGSLDSAQWEAFDGAAKDLLDGWVNYPGGSGTVFDFHLDYHKHFSLMPWEASVPSFEYRPDLPYSELLVPSVDTTRYGALLDCLLAVDRSVLLTGPAGAGKSALVRRCLQNQQATSRTLAVTLHFSAQTSAAATQAALEARLEKKRKRRYGAPAGRRLLLFVDDVSMPSREPASGAQPPIELLRHFQDFRGLYDRKKLFWKEVEDTVLLAACGPPGGGRQEMTPRFVRHFSQLALPPASEVALRAMFGAIMGGFLDTHFQPDVRNRLLRPLVDTAVEVYSHVAAELLPTPAKSHYAFSLRDVSSVFGGMLAIRPPQCGADPRGTLTRLWLHEHMRVYHDRLVSEQDKTYFKRLLYSLLRQRFDIREEYDKLFSPHAPVLFGDYMRRGGTRDERVYTEVKDVRRLEQLFEGYLEEYNSGNHGPRMDLVLFTDAIEHVSRICRVLRQPRGNAMLVGVGGSGKQSLARFAAFIAETQVFTLELARGYGMAEFREDLKKLYRLAGVEGRSVAFLLPEQHILSEAFVEDVSNLLSSGEVAGLFGQEERDKIFSDLRTWAAAEGLEDTRDAMWTGFVNRVRDNLHVLLALSPVGDAFRSRCRRFPSLLAATTIDWFSEWPQEALLSVSQRLLGEQELGGSAVAAAVARTCVDVHTSAVEAAERYHQELRRRHYVTPRSYLDLINLYTSLLATKRQETAVARERLLTGVSKLTTTNSTVEEMRQQLRQLQPVLADKTEATTRLLEQVTVERYEAERMRASVADEETDVKAQTAQLAGLKDEAQANLEEVLPALEAAEHALSALNKADIIEIKTFTKPPQLVQVTMEAVCILLQDKTDWEAAKRLLGDATFIKRLMEYDRDNIPHKVVRQLKRIIDDPNFTPEQVAKQSKAAQSLCLWVRAMDTYARVLRVVEPKRQALAGAQERLGAMSGALLAKQQQLAALEARVAKLQSHLHRTQEELHSLQSQADTSRRRLARAERLTGALAEESVRWLQRSDELTAALRSLVGDVFLAAACISYLGPFTGPYREALLRGWAARCREAGIPTSADGGGGGGGSFSLPATLVSPVEIREWGMQGLPHDSLSVDNGVLVTRGNRWPLCIDPQDQAGRWIKAMELKNSLRVIRLGDPAAATASMARSLAPSLANNTTSPSAPSAPGTSPADASALAGNASTAAPSTLTSAGPASAAAPGAAGGSVSGAAAAGSGGGGVPLHLLEQCVRQGQPVLLEDVGEGPLDPVLEPLLTRATYTVGTRLCVRLGDSEVDYDPRFRLYLTTRLPNPHYVPEVCIKVNLINFTVTPQGLEDQLLGDVVRQERPDLEEARDRLVVSLSLDKRQLAELEDRVLALLREASPASLLDDEDLVATLNNAKQTSGVIASRVAEAEATEAAINEAREVYRPVPTRGSLLYFVTADLAAVDPMYQTSLAAFVRAFRHCLDAAPRADDLGSRLRALLDTTTDHVYRLVCRGLFDAHKLVYAFTIAAAIERQQGTVSPAEWNVLLRGGRAPAAAAPATPPAATSAASFRRRVGGGLPGVAEADPAASAPPPPQRPAVGVWASGPAWDGAAALEAALPGVFGGLTAAIAQQPEAWQALLEHPTPDRADLGGIFTPPPSYVRPVPPPGPAVQSPTKGSLNGGSSAGLVAPPSAQLLASTTMRRHKEGLAAAAKGSQGERLAGSPAQKAVGPGAAVEQGEGVGTGTPGAASPPAPPPSRELTSFHRLLLIKALCEVKLMGAICRYVSDTLGPHFTEPPPASLAELFADSSPAAPLVFITAPGADPGPAIQRLAAAQGRAHRLHAVSLGQGQGPRAEALLHAAVRSGDWLLLHNCHLAASWMPRLERLVEDLQARYAKQVQFSSRPKPPSTGTSAPTLSGFIPSGTSLDTDALASSLAPHDTPGTPAPHASTSAAGIPYGTHGGLHGSVSYDVHPDFRLWLTSNPTPAFPVSVLQSGVKAATEPPKGVRATLMRIYSEVTDELLDFLNPQAAAASPSRTPSPPKRTPGGGVHSPSRSRSPASGAAQLTDHAHAARQQPPPSPGSLPLPSIPHQPHRRAPLPGTPPTAAAHVEALGPRPGTSGTVGLGLGLGGGVGAASISVLPPHVTGALGPAWRRLLFACALFHAVLQERRRYGPLGWNVPYEFSDGDLGVAVRTLQMFVVEGALAAAGRRPGTPPAFSGGITPAGAVASAVGLGGGGLGLQPSHESYIPWDALVYVTGDIVYGGRVTDENDRRLMACLLRRFYHSDVLREGHPFCPDPLAADAGAAAGAAQGTGSSSLGVYRQPADGDAAWYGSVVRGLPHADAPGVFGLHPNADLRLHMQDTRRLMDTLLAMQPRVVGGAGAAATGGGSAATAGPAAAGPADARSADELTAALAEELVAALPPPLSREAAATGPADPFAPLPSGHDNSLGVVLVQEVARANGLVGLLRRSLAELGRAVRGLAVMSADLEQLATCLLNNQVPPAWRRASYPSNKPLGAWVADVRARVEQLSVWLSRGPPPAFWLPGLFFPQGFVTAVMQNAARRSRVPIDRLSLGFRVLGREEEQQLEGRRGMGGAGGSRRVLSEVGRGSRAASGSTAGTQVQQEEAMGAGVLVYGLFLEGARWEHDTGTLAEARPGEMFARLPPVELLPRAADVHPATPPASQPRGRGTASPTEPLNTSLTLPGKGSTSGGGGGDGSTAQAQAQPTPHVYSCPLYKTSSRGNAAGGGSSLTSLFVLHLLLPIPLHTAEDFWVMQGAAALCAADD